MVRWETDKTGVNIQARSLMARVCTKLGRNAKLKEKHKWSDEKPKLDNARRLRGIYFIDPEDKEFKETIRAWFSTTSEPHKEGRPGCPQG